MLAGNEIKTLILDQKEEILRNAMTPEHRERRAGAMSVKSYA